jgi:hypothetical protein
MSKRVPSATLGSGTRHGRPRPRDRERGPTPSSSRAPALAISEICAVDCTKTADDAAKALAEGKTLAHLEHIDVTGSGVTDAGSAALRSRFGSGVIGP